MIRPLFHDRTPVGALVIVQAITAHKHAEQEIQQIQSRAFEDARNLADALNNPDEVANYLGLKAPDQPETPAVNLPTGAGDTAVDPAAAGQ